MMGLSIMVSFLSNLKHLGETLSIKNDSEKNAFVACTIGLSGLMACILCFVSDFLYYMNRNQLIFVYLESSAFPVGFLLVSATLHNIAASSLASSVNSPIRLRTPGTTT